MFRDIKKVSGWEINNIQMDNEISMKAVRDTNFSDEIVISYLRIELWIYLSKNLVCNETQPPAVLI